MIDILSDLIIPEDELIFEFVRASGPGGQNINKVATAAQLRFDVRNSPSLPEPVRQRLVKLAGKRISTDGILLIEAKRYRTQERNRQDALARLNALLNNAEREPKPRKKTRPTAASQQRRLDAKRRRGETKRLRGQVDTE